MISQTVTCLQRPAVRLDVAFPIFSPEFSRRDERQFIERFIAVRNQLPEHLRAFLTLSSATEYITEKVALYLHRTENAGYGISPQGELVSVFSLPGNHLGAKVVQDALEHGATFLHCFDGFLPKFYGRVGFIETGRIQWNDKYAPKGWDLGRFGRPDILTMHLHGVRH